MPPVTGWFDPSPKGGFLRLAANSYLPAKGDPPVRLPGLRRGDLLTLENGRVLGVNGAAPGAPLGDRPEFAQLGAVHPSRPVCCGPRMTDDGERGILREELPWLPSPAGSTPPPTAAPYGSPPTVTCPRKVIPVCVSRGCGAATSSRWNTGAW